MKKALKIGLLSLASIVLVVAIAVSILLFSVFSPSKLAKIVNNQADKYITCDFHVDKVGLTFFKTFPKIGLDLENVLLKNPQKANVSDTLLYVKDCVAALNIRELLNNKHAEINDFSLKDGFVNLYIDENGKGNYDVFRRDPNDTTDFDYTIDLQKVKAKKFDLYYQNDQSNQTAELRQTDFTVNGTFENPKMVGQLDLTAENFRFVVADSTSVQLSSQEVQASYNGSFTNFNLLDGNLDANFQKAVFCVDTTHYINGLDFSIASDVQADLNNLRFDLQETQLKLDKQELSVNGIIDMDTTNHDIHTDLHYKTDDWQIEEVLPMIPRAIIGDKLDDMQISGDIALEGTVKGTFSDTQTPIITSDIAWHKGRFAMKDMPLDFEKADGLFDLHLDMDKQSDVTVKSLSATTRKRNRVTAKGTVKNLLGKMLLDIFATGDLHITDFKDFLPEDFIQYGGKADIQLKTQFEYDPDKDFSLDNVKNAKANCAFSNLSLLYYDSTLLTSPQMKVDVELPVTQRPYKINEWMNAKIAAGQLNISNAGQFNVAAADVHLDAYTNDLLDSTIELKFATTYQFDQLKIQADTIAAQLSQPKGVFVLYNTDKMRIDYAGSTVDAVMGNAVKFHTQTLNLHAETDYKDNEEHPLLRWSPVVQLQLANAKADFQNVAHALEIPALNIDFNTQKCVLKKANIGFGQSNASITGTISGIKPYLHGTGLLKGNLDLVANYLNLNELMDLVDGYGAPDSLTAQAKALAAENEDSPFIVPFGIDVNMNTTIKKALFEEAEFRNIAGRVYVKDGVLVLEEMGLTNDAARMQLTAMYRTPRMNHLFLGFDFHLLDIKIDKLIAMIPEVDTVMPMLKAFSGSAEFHFAAETYLKSNYDIKFSTLRGAAAINGHDLVVLDSETYRNIAKKLKFNKKTENRIDSLSTEFTIYKNEIDVYPFLLSIDKYSAIISGRHNLDMTYDYNISLLKPLRIGLEIDGMGDRLKFKVGKPKYANLFKPEKQNVVESNIMELKTLINKTLQSNVKDDDAMKR
jgi:hypothetical protein